MKYIFRISARLYYEEIIRIFIKSTAVILSIVIIYLLIAFSLSYIPVNNNFKECEKDAVEIYILTNGVHTDLVLPLRNQYNDWSKFVNSAETKSKDTTFGLVGFGWGDKGFYLQTKTWSDLKFSTAFKAIFYLSQSAMHVTFHDQINESATCRKICIDKESYLKLVDYITQSFLRNNNNGMPVMIKEASYGVNDSFYEAKGTYGLFNTCNTWANEGLKYAGLKAAFWSPFDKGIFHHYKPARH